MADPIREALERLMAVVEQDRRSQHDAMTLIAMADPVGEALDDARAALEAAPSDGPAVPPAEGREPAAVVDEPSDQNLYDFWIATSPELGCADPVGFARAVLARWGRPAAPKSAGEPSDNEPDLDHEIALLCDSIVAAHAAQVNSKEPIISSEWHPCVKLPVTIHVRKQRPGEIHVSTREGITPVRPDDLIMLGVQGEEYPIGREIFEKTYQLLPISDSKLISRDSHLPPPEVCDWLLSQDWSGVMPKTVITYPEGGPDGISKSERFDHVSARIAIGSDDIADVFMPSEALGMLRSDQIARNRASAPLTKEEEVRIYD